MIKKLITLFKLGRKVAKSDILNIASKFKKPPLAVTILFQLLSISFSKKEQKDFKKDEGERLSSSLENMGTTFIKLGQFLATRPDIIGEELSSKLENLQDRLPAFSINQAKEIIRNDLGDETYNSIIDLSEPVAAASIAQVHKAKINDDGTIKDVAIKILRPNIKKIFNEEIDQNSFQITYAKKGVFKEFNNMPVLVLYDGATITGKNDKITNLSFSKSNFPLNNFKSNTTTYKKTQELSSFELFQCLYFLETKKKMKYDLLANCTTKNLQNVYKEIYKRLLIPFYIPLLVLIPFLLILSSKESSNYSKLKTITFLIGLFFIIFSETTIKLISTTHLENIVISSLPFLFLIILYSLFFKKTNFKYFIK